MGQMRRLCVLAVAALLVLSGPVFGLTVDQAKCRRNMGKGLRRVVVVAVRQKALCFKLFMREQLDSTIDCNDINTWQDRFGTGLRAIERSIVQLQRLAALGCLAPATPAELGYTVCPPPCAASALTDFVAVSECLQCLGSASTADVIEAAYGEPPMLLFPEDRPVQRCQDSIGKVVKIRINVQMKLQQLCQLLQDRDKVGFEQALCRDILNPEHPFFERFNELRLRLDDLIDACVDSHGVDIGEDLNMCGVDPDTTKQCVGSATNACADLLFDAGYPLVPATPTPTATAAPTDTTTAGPSDENTGVPVE